MSKALAIPVLVGLIGFAGQAASATTRHTRGPLIRSPSTTSERIRGASAFITPREHSTNPVFQYEEALSPPAGTKRIRSLIVTRREGALQWPRETHLERTSQPVHQETSIAGCDGRSDQPRGLDQFLRRIRFHPIRLRRQKQAQRQSEAALPCASGILVQPIPRMPTAVPARNRAMHWIVAAIILR
jgi:hypothetical protein